MLRECSGKVPKRERRGITTTTIMIRSLSKLETRLWIGGFLHDWHRSSQNLNSPIPTFESPSVLVPTAHVVVDNEMPFKTTAAIAQINLIGMIKTMVDE